ncbi:energy transducer TonB [Salinispirillum sp. LH 10-3-1]|uniref:Energy transducer TonB n=1 Tax=Salinispirillum sp. LH 10-3-1 TaxID=2952525 RepID=A0AB38YDQ9_9GAMM
MINSARSIRRILLVLTLSVGLHLAVALGAALSMNYWWPRSPSSVSSAESSRTLSLALVSSPEESIAEAQPTDDGAVDNAVEAPAAPTPAPPAPEPDSSLPPPITTDEPASSTISDVLPEPEPELQDHGPEPIVEPEVDIREEFDPIPLLSEIESQSADVELAKHEGAESTVDVSSVDDQAALEDNITSLLRQALAAQLRYPERLRRRQAEDCVTARVDVTDTGAVSLLAITEASRQREFNQEVTRAIGALPRLKLDQPMTDSALQISVPVCFTLAVN